MKIVIFINKTNRFANGLIRFLEENISEHSMEYYVVDRKDTEELPEWNNVHKIYKYREFLTNTRLRNSILNCDKILASGIFAIQYILPFFPRQVLKKTYLQFWGGDFYQFRNKNSLRKRFDKIFYDVCVKHSKAVILLLADEKEEFLQIFNYDKEFFYVPVASSSEDKKQLYIERDRLMSEVITCQRKIVIGNSATETNRHIELFRLIQNIDFEDAKVYCPLSYGDSDYRKKIIEEGKHLFGDNFIPITEYMTKDEYINFLSNCDVGIYYHNRQQGLGNISLMLDLGKKVYLSKNSTVWKYYESFEYILNDIESVKNVNDIFNWPDEKRFHNFACMNNRQDMILNTWKDILND